MSTIVVRRRVTLLLLVAVTAGIVLATLWMSGKSYSKIDPIPFHDLNHLARRLAHRPMSTRMVAIVLMPIVANVLLFVPWGFFLFLALYNAERPTIQTYVLTILLGISFTSVIEAWQYFLPSRVADINDIIWNTLGAGLGAVLGHMRARVRFEFE